MTQVLSDGFNTEADLYNLKQRQSEINADIAAITDRQQRAEKEAQGNKVINCLCLSAMPIARERGHRMPDTHHLLACAGIPATSLDPANVQCGCKEEGGVHCQGGLP